MFFLISWICFSSTSVSKLPAPSQTPVNLQVVTSNQNYFLVKYQYQTFYLNKHFYWKGSKQQIVAEIDDMIILLNPTFQLLQTRNNFYEFDFQTYLAAINVNYQVLVNPNTSIKVQPQKTIRTAVWNLVNQLPPPVREYTAKLLMQKGLDLSIQSLFSQWGIVAFLTVSGFHINLLAWILQKIFRFKNNQYWQFVIIVIILSFYLYLINWAIAGLRACLMYLIAGVNRLRGNPITKISCLCLVAYFCLLISPLQFYHLGWQLSFGISFLLLFFIDKIQHYKKIWKMIISAGLIFLICCPIQMLLNQSISLFSVFYQIIFAPLIAFFYFALMINLFLTPIIDINWLMTWLLNGFEQFVWVVNRFDYRISSFTPTVWMLQLYYSLLFLIYSCLKFANWRLLTVVSIKISLLGAIWIAHFIKPYYEITFMNVGNAMSIIIVSPWNQSVMMIDAGIEMYRSQDTIYHYLKAKGIHHINALFLTHNDSDHINNVPFLTRHIIIQRIYRNNYQQPQYHVKQFLPVINVGYSLISWLKNASENNRSLVLRIQLFNTSFLVTGDIEALTENLLLTQNLLSKIDILQVAHHGSKTSTSLSFLKAIQPQLAIISGQKKVNRSFPDELLLERLANLKIAAYWTGKHKTIIIRVFQYTYQIITLQ